ncbi:Dynactin subunit 4 [Ceratocystis fimbriata CBS 114723]|uniref:Dynactin subunit 4 n=1 Tax=Ceratocystis fimbriata CBS 114723 TaxID=1035309 RepID=A0A2C5X502_9PEZI|nr:Dynactin subunit 4 [Ceratocystis fimbriata CBS 114723]
MASLGPYTFIQCPCSDPSTIVRSDDNNATSPTDPENDIDDDDDMAFDPRAPRANYSLFPLEYLMYCADCHEIRCPRCVGEEITIYYCPSCIFEVPSSNIKSEGNRCTRSCFQCPVCVGTLVVTSLDRPSDRSTAAASTESAPPPTPTSGGPYALNCTYCLWSSSEIGIEFDKSNGVYGQLSRVRNGGAPKLSAREFKEKHKDGSADGSGLPTAIDPDIHFSNLKAFYQNQSSDMSSSSGSGIGAIGDLGFGSPGSLSRIMSLYTGGSMGGKRTQPKNTVLSEASSITEGLKPTQLDESAALAKLRASRWEDTVSMEQNENQLHHCRFTDELRPVPVLLRTKRSKRCPVCRHIIAKPEAKVLNTRYRIRLVASSFVPSISIKPMNPGPPPPSRNIPVAPTLPTLQPHTPTQFILTFQNPIFETIKITLATASTTPGRFPSKVTLLCPQFTVDANTDMWDDALKNEGDKRRTRGPDEMNQAEAGKIWDRGRNWVSIVLEVVPASLDLQAAKPAKGDDQDVHDPPLREDEDILEIPLFVRVEWEVEAQESSSKDKMAKEKKELAYWCVLGVGRIGTG